ncbi:MAG: HAMP domain-containing protein [Anaerolineales bacterium]|nr:HAMP domain-containing protein [Anaerolineales bacterium]
MRIRQRLLLGFLGVVAIFALFGGYVYVVWQTIIADLDQLDHLFEETAVHTLGEIDATLHLSSNLEISRRALDELLLGVPTAEEELRSSLIEFDTYYTELDANLAREADDSPEAGETQADLQDIETRHEHIQTDVDEVFSLIDNGRIDTAFEHINAEIKPEISQISNHLIGFEEEIEQHAAQVSQAFDSIIHSVESKIGRMQTAIILALGGGILAAFLLGYFTSESISEPIERLAQAATAVEQGSYEIDSLTAVTQRKDELGQFARTFEQMAREVYAREQKLKAQVSALQIEIDRTKSAAQVAEITDTDFFKDLQNKAQAMRARKQS